MVVACPCSFDLLMKGSRCSWLNSRKHNVRKIWNGGEILKTSRKLTTTAFSMQLIDRDGGSRPLFPWLTEGGWFEQPMEQQLNWKEREAVKKCVEWGRGKYQWEENSQSLLSPRNIWARDDSGSSHLPCRLREGDQHGQWDSNLIEKEAVITSLELWGK